jgi:hypothetical protein
MRSERYTENEIEEIYSNVDQKNNEILRKYILRMKLKINPDSKYMSYAWERLKMYSAHRKYVRY